VEDPATDTALFAATINQIQQSKNDASMICSVIRKGELDENIDPIMAVAQLWTPNPWNPLKLRDLRLLRDGSLKVPHTLCLDAYEANNLQVMLTPKYSWSQFRFGTATTFQLRL
jgi:hypothetical protein